MVSGTVLAISGQGLVAPAQAAPIPGVDLQVTMTGPTNQLLGAPITDSILIVNAGTDPATGVAFDLAPPVTGATYSITDPSVTCNLSWHCTLADLAGGAQKAVVLKIATAAPLADGATVTAQATVSTTATDVDPSNDVASASTELSPHSQLSLSIQRTSTGALLPGAPTTYKLTMKNNGPGAAVDPVVGVSSPNPPFSSHVAGTASNGGVCHTQQSESYAWCTWATVPAGATRTMNFTTITSPYLGKGDPFEVDAGVAATNMNGVTTISSTTVMSDSTTRPTDVSVTTYMTPSVKAGKRGDWKVTVTNRGPYRAHHVVVTAVLPPGAHWVGIAGGSPSDGTHSHTIGDLDTGVSYVVRGWFSMSVGGHMSMQYKVSHTDPDSKPANNYSKSVSHILGPVVTVAHTKSSTAPAAPARPPSCRRPAPTR